ncbi:hypothetical protein V5O48_015746 [Marasmius crinis-equi]|uniref:DUF985 domain-containing protein n=1 Tax=Marasmius crinis-equi TaxID=585013 RepID=A0ABR3ETN9_9AGAR
MSVAVSTSTIQAFQPAFRRPSNPSTHEKTGAAALISKLHLLKHCEGGYYSETDRDERRVANPFHPSYSQSLVTSPSTSQHTFSDATFTGQSCLGIEPWAELTRSASTSIYYLLTENWSRSCFVRNRGRTVHTLHKGRARYVVIHADEAMIKDKVGEGEEIIRGKARVETFIVGQNIVKGEKLQWVIAGDKYKASFLLPDEEGGGFSEEGCLITETVIPGFEFTEWDSLQPQRLYELVTPEQADQLAWLLA